MAVSNRDRIGKGLEFLRDGLIPFVERELRQYHKGQWKERAQRANDGRSSDKMHWDNQALLKTMVDEWQAVFFHTLGHTGRSLIGELIDIRNNWAHDKAFTSDDAYRALDTMHRLLVAISAGKHASDLDAHKQELLRTVYAEQSRNKARYSVAVEGQPKEGLRPWREIVTPHKDVQSGNYMQAEFAADLAQVHRGEGSDEYREPVEFFRRTFITDGLRELLDDALRRLVGKDGDPVIELQTNFGGGKTHSMLALFHLFGGANASTLPGVEAVLKNAGVDNVPKANRAVLVGTALSPGEIIKKPDGVEVRTLWGEMAWQLGGEEAYALVADSDKRAVSPGSNELAKLFQKCSPCLVLIDEWVAYARQLVGKTDLPAGDFDAQFTFAQALTEAAKAVPKTLVVASIPASNIEIGGDSGRHALESLKNVFERLGKPWRPASSDEGFEIVRRRLFEPIEGRDRHALRDAVLGGFSRMYRESRNEFPPGTGEEAYRRKLEAAYPLHPELFERLYNEWSTLDKFQRTRGVLRLLAKVVHALWEGNDQSLLILPSSVPLDEPSVKSELTRYLDDNWEPIISHDVDGPQSLPLDLDRATPNLGRYSACRRVARSLYMGTAPGSKGKNPGIDDRQVRLGCTQPGETPATFGDALRRLTDRGTYLYVDQGRYWYSTQPSVSRLANDRANQIDLPDVHAEIVRRIQKEKERGEFAFVHTCPESSSDVPDEPGARLVVLRPDQAHRKGDKESPSFAEAKRCLGNRGTSPRLNRNSVVFLVPDKQRLEELESATRQYLAWRSISDEHEKLNLDTFQRKQAETKQRDQNETVDLRIKEAWVWSLVPVQPDPKGEVTWEELKLSGPAALAKRVSDKLVNDELLLVTLGGGTQRGFGGLRLRMALDKYLWREQDHVSAGALWEYFSRYVYLPRLQTKETLFAAIQNGAQHTALADTFAIAAEYDAATKRYTGLTVSRGTPVDNGTLVVKPEVAAAQLAADDAAAAKATGHAPPNAGAATQGTAASAHASHGAVVASRPTVTAPPKLFVGSVRLDGERVGRDAGRVNQEVIEHLATLPGAEVMVTLEVQVRVPGGVPGKVISTVRENCTALKFRTAEFEGE